MLRFSLAPFIALALVAQDPKPADAPKPKEASAQAEAKPEVKTPEAPKPPAAAKAEASKAEKKVNSEEEARKIVARVNGKPITNGEVDTILETIPPQQRQQMLMMGGKKEFIKRLAESKLLAEKARKLGLDKSDTYKAAYARVADDLLAQELVKKEGSKLQTKSVVTDEELKAYYEENKTKKKEWETASARHILIMTKGPQTGDKGLAEADAKKKAEEVRDKLKAGGNWDELAKSYSDDPGSKDKGGLYENFNPGGMVPEFAEAVRTQPEGEVGNPVKTQFGFHVIKVEKKPEVEPFEKAKEKIRPQAGQEKQQKVWEEFISGLKTEIPFHLGEEKASAGETAKPAAPAVKKPAAKKAEKPAQK